MIEKNPRGTQIDWFGYFFVLFVMCAFRVGFESWDNKEINKKREEEMIYIYKKFGWAHAIKNTHTSLSVYAVHLMTIDTWICI